jgi:hypothetical protein
MCACQEHRPNTSYPKELEEKDWGDKQCWSWLGCQTIHTYSWNVTEWFHPMSLNMFKGTARMTFTTWIWSMSVEKFCLFIMLLWYQTRLRILPRIHSEQQNSMKNPSSYPMMFENWNKQSPLSPPLKDKGMHTHACAHASNVTTSCENTSVLVKY